MKSREQEKEERRLYEGDVAYEVWRGGGNIDRIDYDRVSDRYYDGQNSEDTARQELRRQRRPSVDFEAPTEEPPENK